MLGVAGLMEGSTPPGRVANAMPRHGRGDDKLIYAYVPGDDSATNLDDAITLYTLQDRMTAKKLDSTSCCGSRCALRSITTLS